jgi:erythromycin esterase-like protein
MLKNGVEAWDMRAGHMFRTLRRILEHRGEGSKAIVWAHNSHVGDAKATNVSQGDVNLGRLVRERIGEDVVALLGCGTHTGTVAAAKEWGGDLQYIPVPPSIPESHEAVAHGTGLPSFFVDLREGKCDPQLRKELVATRKERFIGVVFDPEADPESHYADALLADQFDGYIWFDETGHVKPFEIHQPKTTLQLADTYPWGL